MAKTIVISSGKGGVGKTVTAVNLGIALNSLGKNVTILDSNLTTPNVALHLGSPVVPITLNHVLQGKKHIYRATYTHHSGTKVVPSSISLEAMKGINPSRLATAIKDLKKISDFVIVDSAAGLGREALLPFEALDENDEILIVTNPEMPALADALKTIKLAEKLKKRVSGVIITRARNKKPELSTKNIKEMLEKPILAKVPEDDSVRESIALRNALVLTHPNSRAAKSYKRLAAKIAGEEYKPESKGFFSSLFSWMFK
ncbi:MAG: cell division ATPase MinD [Candidatus Pacearchaeota archaeon]